MRFGSCWLTKFASNDLNSSRNKKTQDWFKREQALQISIQQHRLQTETAFPSLPDLENPSSIALPSTYELSLPDDDNYCQWLSTELDLRVGLGHDLLQELRSAAGVHNYYSRKQKDTRGQKEMKNVARSQQSVSRKKSRFIQQYIDNWGQIQILLNLVELEPEETTLRLRGLRPLSRADDFSFFHKNPTEFGNVFDKAGNHGSWIWRVAMLGDPDQHNTQTLLELCTEWESEGAIRFY